MTTPGAALEQTGLCFGVGALLGLLYGFLRPLRPRHTGLSDLLFLPGFFYGWLYCGFAICRGDLRLAYTAAMLLGIWITDRTVGRLLRPAFSFIWKVLAFLWSFFTFPVRKFLYFVS